MFGMGPWEMVGVFLVILLLFGAKRLPEIGGSLGKGIREFKDSIKDVEGEVRREIAGPSEPPSPPAEKEAAPAAQTHTDT